MDEEIKKQVTDTVFAAIHDMGMAKAKLRTLEDIPEVDRRYLKLRYEDIDSIVDKLRYEVTNG